MKSSNVLLEKVKTEKSICKLKKNNENLLPEKTEVNVISLEPLYKSQELPINLHLQSRYS